MSHYARAPLRPSFKTIVPLAWKEMADDEEEEDSSEVDVKENTDQEESDHEEEEEEEEEEIEDEDDIQDDEKSLDRGLIRMLISHFSKRNYTKRYIRKYIELISKDQQQTSVSSEEEDEENMDEDEVLTPSQEMLLQILRTAQKGHYRLTLPHLTEIVDNILY